ncbi:hypothetical protein [Streptosporangium sp. NPDC087985]|uniref:hypothetical protein n=1 Tax=Streptosporangium sp. NPDC087985 TaxID=3366196 RepID=UPI00381AD33B
MRRLTVPGLAVLLLMLTVADVLAFGGAHVGDRVVFRDGLPPRSGAWHTLWRVLVMGGQYWLVGSAAALAAAWAAWRARSLRLLLVGGRGIGPLRSRTEADDSPSHAPRIPAEQTGEAPCQDQQRG